MAGTLQQLGNDIKKTADETLFLVDRVRQLQQEFNRLGGGGIANIERQLAQVGTTGETMFASLSKGSGNTLMEMNRLRAELNRLRADEQAMQQDAVRRIQNDPQLQAQAQLMRERAKAHQEASKLNQMEYQNVDIAKLEAMAAAIRQRAIAYQQATQAAAAFNQVANAGGVQRPTMGGSNSLGILSNLATGRHDDNRTIGTKGFVTPFSPGINLDNEQINRAAAAGIRNIIDLYKDADQAVQNFSAHIEQATGKLVVQADVVRDLGNGVNQTFKVTSTVDPKTGATSDLSESQQAFVNQAGGLEEANRQLSRYGLNINNVTGFYKDLNSNVSRFSVLGTDGISTAMGSMNQFGTATLHASRNAQTLWQNVQRNITKVIEWSVATGLVYTAMNSLFQASKELLDIEETMADIAIATGAAGDELDRYYESALDVANLTGVDVTDTLEAQAKAYRAASGEADRFSTANVLLKDSMVLARLSGMDQTKALDTLVAALRQTGKGLQDGTQLLDKWVRTTQNAGVSIEDLAESFAITSDVADTVGVDVDQLNGLISVLAEKTTLSSTEIGNALRTMFANITAPEAVSTLEEFGIAVRDVEGNMRSWMDITQNIVDLMNSGVLNDEQINKLANALGGGSRRGPQLIALWQNFGRANDIAEQSFMASGEAADAMAVKLETLQAAINELHNAFNELVQTLGYDGGFLELVTDAIKFSTSFVKGINDIAEAFDGAAASIGVAVVAYMTLSKMMGKMDTSFLGGASTAGRSGFGANAGMIHAFGSPVDSYGPGGTSGGTNFGRFMTEPANRYSGQAAIQGLGAAAPIVAGEIASGIANHESWNRVGARAGSSIAGAMLGNMVLPGFGGVIGAVMADAFVRQIQNKEDAFRALATGAASTPQEKMAAAVEGTSGAFDLQSIGRDLRNKYTDEELLMMFAGASSKVDFSKVSAPQGAFGSVLNTLSFGQQEEDTAKSLQAQFGLTEDEAKIVAAIFTTTTQEQRDLLLDAAAEYEKSTANLANAAQSAQTIPQSVQDISSLLRGPEGRALDSSFTSQESDLYRNAGMTGSVEEYNKITGLMDQVTNATAAVATAFYGVNQETERLNASTAEYIGLGNLLLNTTDEQRNKIITLASEINNLRDELAGVAEAQAAGQTWAFGSEVSDKQRQLERDEELLRNNIELTEHYNALQFTRDNYISPTQGPTDSQGNALTKDQAGFSEALEYARSLQDAYAEFRGLDPELLKETVTDPLVLAFADGYVEIEGLTSDFASIFMDKMKEIAESSKEQMNFTFRDLSDTPASMIDNPAFAQRLKANERMLETAYGPYGYDEEKQNVGLMLEGNQTRVLNTTMTALNLTLEELTEVEKKQLEGQWNLPSGATAYVPINSLFAQQNASSIAAGPAGGAPYNTGIQQNTEAANKQLQAAQMQLQAAEAQRIRDLDSSRWEGLGAQYAKGQGEPVRVENKTDVTVNPGQTIIKLNETVIGNAVSKFLAQGLTETIRTTPNSGSSIN